MTPQKKPHHLAFRLAEPCICGSAWGRPAVDTADAKITQLCAGENCRRPVDEDGRTVIEDCMGCGKPVESIPFRLQLSDGRHLYPIHGTKSCAVKASRAHRAPEASS